MTSSGDILGGGFGVIGKRPLSVAVWALLQAALAMVSLVFVLPRMIGVMQTAIQQAATNPNGNPASQVAMMQSMTGVQGLSWLLSLGGSLLGAVILCAAFRAVVRPQDGGFASLKLGMDEVRIFAMTWVVSIGGVVCGIIGALILVLVSLLFSFLLGSVQALATILIVLLWIAAICAVIYCVVRLSMLFPLTFIRREFVFDEAWKVTRGRFWTLFLPYFVIVLVVWLLSAVAFVPIGWSMFANLPTLPQGNDPQAAQAFVASFMTQWFSHPFGTLGVMMLLFSIVQVISTALYGGAMATAAQGFLADDGRLPEIFE